jgi:hypothetical protein
MQRFHRLLTSLVFTAHALLGCGVHHACQYGLGVIHHTADYHSGHVCRAHGHDDSSAPANDDQEPTNSCQHVACSFVKAETPRIDFASRHVAGLAATLPVEQDHGGQLVSTAGEPVCMADLSSTQLYVWHCALLI